MSAWSRMAGFIGWWLSLSTLVHVVFETPESRFIVIVVTIVGVGLMLGHLAYCRQSGGRRE